VLGGLAEFERDLIRTRTGEGRERAKARGVKLGRKPKADRPSAAGGDQAPRRGRRADPRHCPQLQRPQQYDFTTDGLT
jgi:DNA invertase Pin-like site-specific DNA recombinase